MHQEPEDVSKPEWIRDHDFSALALLLSEDKAMFVAPVLLKLHNGLRAISAPPRSDLGREDGPPLC